MTVKELIDLLGKEDPGRLVVMSKDAEGNGFSPLSRIEAAAYCAERPWHGYIELEKLTERDKKEGYSEEDVITNGVKALVLWPVN